MLVAIEHDKMPAVERIILWVKLIDKYEDLVFLKRGRRCVDDLRAMDLLRGRLMLT